MSNASQILEESAPDFRMAVIKRSRGVRLKLESLASTEPYFLDASKKKISKLESVLSPAISTSAVGFPEGALTAHRNPS
jgi:hypothetical protein